MRDGDPVRAEQVLREALDLWRGPAFADFPDAGFVAAQVRRWEMLRETAHQDLYEAGLALGRHAELVGELTAYTDRHPLAERGWEMLALALYRCGLQADALAAIRRATSLLADEFGLDVGPSLRGLETAILRQDPALEPRAPSEAANCNLPYPVTGFVGREPELRDLAGLLDRARLVTVTGPGGVGKTLVALEVCQPLRFSDGPWFVDLAGLRQPELVAATVAEALGVQGVATAQRLAAVLGSRRLLLLLDNCEHLVDAVRELCATVLAGCGHVRVLATSRESLGITGEAVSELGPMGRDASELFLSRAAAVQPQWRPEPADHPVIERICAELDVIPLAIELAAAQLRVLSLDQIAGSLGGTDDRFGVDDRFGMATAAAQPPAISGSFARAQAVYESCRIGSGPDPTHGACGEGQRGFEPLGGQVYIPDDCAPGKPQDASGDPVGDCILGLMNGRLAALAARYEQHSRELAAGEYVEGMPDVQAVIDELTLADTFVRRT